MCGIYGIAALRSGTSLEPVMLGRLAAVTVHRGPDDEGPYRHDELMLGMRRLSIIDVAGGHQPIANEDGAVSSRKIRNGRFKHVMKHALAGVLPPEILGRPKRGFAAPIGAWSQDELVPLSQSVLGRDVVEARGLVRWKAVERTLALHQARQDDCTDQLLALTNLELWARIHLDGRSPEDAAGELGVVGAR